MSRFSLFLALAFGTATPALAQSASTAPNAEEQCPAKPPSEGDYNNRDKPLELPDDWRGFADSSMNWIAVTSDLGTVHCVDTSWYSQAGEFEQLGERFLGFEWQGYEAWGYVLIDRAATGASMDLGAKPHFSPSGGYLATIQVSEAGWGGFEGFAVWRTYIGGMVPVHVDTHIPYKADWRIDKWEGESCLHLSAIPYDRITDWDKLDQYARDRYVAWSGGGWKLREGESCSDA